MKSGVWFVLLAMPLAVGCQVDPQSSRGFTLPEGDPERGRDTFARLQCTACHTVEGVDFETPENREDNMIGLGGETTYVRTYGELVTSIIHPSHRFAYGYSNEQIKADGESKMRRYNDEMTITELCDLVAFLQRHYTLKRYEPTPYMPYP